MTRVLQLIETTGPGGAETVFLSLVRGLGELGWDVVPVVTGPGWLKDQISGLGFAPRQIQTSGAFDRRYLARLVGVIREESVDLVHAHLQGAAVYGALAARMAGVPLVGTFHGFPDLEFHGVSGWVKKQILRQLPARTTCVSGALLKGASEAGVLSRSGSQVVWNGIDPSPYRPEESRSWAGGSSQPNAVFHVGALGNVRPAKDYPTLLRTAAEVKRSGAGSFRFTILGERTDPLFSQLAELRDQLGLSEKDLSFQGFVSDVPKALSDLDLLAISSISEGFSLAAIQAMAAGVPVVSTRCGGPEEIIQDGVNGVLVPVGDPEALAGAILRLADSPELRQRLARAARERVDQLYSLQAVVGEYDAMYRAVLGLSEARA